MECRFSQRALSDLRAIGRHIAKESPGNAKSYVKQLTAHCRKTALSPKIRRIVAHLEGVPLRKALHGNYQIYYAVLEESGDIQGIEVVHVRHGARLEPIFGNDGTIT